MYVYVFTVTSVATEDSDFIGYMDPMESMEIYGNKKAALAAARARTDEIKAETDSEIEEFGSEVEGMEIRKPSDRVPYSVRIHQSYQNYDVTVTRKEVYGDVIVRINLSKGKYQPVSSAARQAYIDGMSEDEQKEIDEEHGLTQDADYPFGH